MRLFFLLLLLTGCTFPPLDAERADEGPHHITNYAALPLRPLNCGTPYDFKICPLPARAPIKIEPLFIPSVIIEELDGRPIQTQPADQARAEDDE